MSLKSMASPAQTASLLKTVLQVLVASLLLALSAQVSFALPFTPVPVSAQTFAVYLIAATLGPKKAVCAVLTYIAEGAMGLPVFAHGAAGPLVLIGPRGGYLAGFVLAAWISGTLAQQARSYVGYVFAFIAGSVTILATGFAWLSVWMGVPQAFAAGVLPFLLGDVLKITSAAAVMKGLRSMRS